MSNHVKDCEQAGNGGCCYCTNYKARQLENKIETAKKYIKEQISQCQVKKLCSKCKINSSCDKLRILRELNEGDVNNEV